MVLTGTQFLPTRGLGASDPEIKKAAYANTGYVLPKPMVIEKLKLH